MPANNLDNRQIPSPKWYRETGSALLRSADPTERLEGIKHILKAHSLNDVEAMCVVGELMLRGMMLRPSAGDPEEHALNLLCMAARKGNPQAQSLLNAYCEVTNY